MSLSIKNATKIVRNAVPDWLKSLPIEGQVRVEEHSRPRISRPTVHIFLELNELIDGTYPHLISNSVADERNKKKKREKHLKGV